MILESSFGHFKYFDVVGMNIFKDKFTEIEIVAHEGKITENVIQETIVLSVTLKANVILYGNYGHEKYYINYDDVIKAVIPKVVFK